MTLVVKSDNEMNNTKAKLTHKKQSKNKLAASNTTAKNLVNIQPKPSPQFILPCQPPFIYPSSNTAAVAAAQQQLFSLQLLMSSPYFAQALAAINNGNNQNANNKNNGTTNSSNFDSTATTAATGTATATTTTTASTTLGESSSGNIANSSNPVNVKATGTTNTTISNPIPMPSSSSSATNSKLASSAPSLPTNTLPFLPPNISLPYLAAALSSLTNQQLLNNKKTNSVSTNITNTTTAAASTSATSPATNAKLSSKNAKVQPKTTLNPSLFPKTDNATAAANAALLLNNSLLSNQFLQFLQQQQQQQKNKPLMVNPFAIPTTSSSAIPIASNAQNKSNTVNISSSFPSSSKVKSKISSSSLLINKSKNLKLSTSPNIKSKIPIKKDPLTISKNHRRTSISQSYDPKNPMNNSLFTMMSNNNNNNNMGTTNKLGSNPIIIKRENDHFNDPVHHGSNSPDSLVCTSPNTTMATSPLLPISIPFSNLNLRSNTGSSPVMESNSLSTLCTIASQEAKIFIPESKSTEKKNMFATLPSIIKEEEGENKMDTRTTTTEETNIFSKLNTTKRNGPASSLLTKNIQNSKIKDEKVSLEAQTSEKPKESSMDEDKKATTTTEVPSSMAIPLPIPMPIAPMSLPTITINNSGDNSRDKSLLQQQSFNATSSVTSPLNLIPSSPQSPTSSTSSSSPNIYHNGIHSVPHSALQRRKSRSMNCSKDYVCELCKPNKRFVQLAHLRIHQRKHTGERPFVCSFCNKSFAQLGNLKTHQRKHTGERPFSCSICFKTFTQSGNLKAHELLHQGVRPFICEWCDKTFTQSGNLKTHQLKMHPELVQNGDESSIGMKSPMSSNHSTPLPTSTTTPSTMENHEDQMMIDHLNEEGSIQGFEEEEEEQMMMIDEDDNESPQSIFSSSKPSHHTLLEMDNDDYDEIQPMESGVIHPISTTSEKDPGLGQSSLQNQDEDEGINFDEEDFERSSKFNSVLEYEGNNNDYNNPPENNLKERQLLKRLKALLKRN